jgi:hypothetical protein
MLAPQKSGEAAVDPGSADEGGEVGGCWCCCVGDIGLSKGGVGWSGGEGDRGESVSNELESGLLSRSSSILHHLFLAFLISGGTVGDGVRIGGSGTVGQGSPMVESEVAVGHHHLIALVFFPQLHFKPPSRALTERVYEFVRLAFIFCYIRKCRIE